MKGINLFIRQKRKSIEEIVKRKKKNIIWLAIAFFEIQKRTKRIAA